MPPLAGYLSCFTNIVHGNRTGMIGTYVGDTIATGNATFEKESSFSEPTFEQKKKNYNSSAYVLFQIEKLEN